MGWLQRGASSPPEAALVYPSAGQVIESGANLALVFQVQASDALGLARVEWWLDGSLTGTLTQAPFSLPWQGAAGVHTLVIKAYDRAGNKTETLPVQFTVR